MRELWKISDDELQEIFRFHEMWVRGEEGGECANLNNTYLEDVYLRGLNLRKATFADAYLLGADLSDANLSDAVFRNANLNRAKLTLAVLNNASLEGANLSDVDLKGAHLVDAMLCNAYLKNACLMSGNLRKAYVNDADLSNANLIFADLSHAVLRNSNVRSSVLLFAELTGADLDHADLRGADIRGASFVNTNLMGADLRDTKWDYGTRLRDVKLDGALLPRGFPRSIQSVLPIELSVFERDFSDAAAELNSLLHPKSGKRHKVLNHLRFFWTFAKHESLYSARKALNLQADRNSQITQHLKRLATLLGLDNKDSRGLFLSPKDTGENTAQLTEAGKALKEWIKSHPQIRKSIEST